MKKVRRRNSATRILLFGIAFLLMFSMPLKAQDAPVGDSAKGKELFNSLCAACHKRYKKATGPALHKVTDRHSMDWLYSWIKNSTAMIAAGDAEALSIYEEYNKTAMNSFPQLSNGDIDNILAYVNEPKGGGGNREKPPVIIPDPGENSGISNSVVLSLLALVLLVLVAVLFVVTKTLKKFTKDNGITIEGEEDRKPIWKAFLDNQFLVLVSAILLLLISGYFVYGYFMQVGIDQGYKPVQPIHFSHKIHAGDNKIECKYCHSSARVSKHSGIPSLNICMNCHKSIQEYNGEVSVEYNKEFYDKEILKLYEATGWDLDKQGYTGETKPVKWIRIHNLPDFAYFNHSQHVEVAGVACQKCHGPVEEMEIMYQHAPLTMGWCINCHRETNVKMEGNAYYDKIHEQLSKKYGVDKLTAAQMGGLECGKCHY